MRLDLGPVHRYFSRVETSQVSWDPVGLIPVKCANNYSSSRCGSYYHGRSIRSSCDASHYVCDNVGDEHVVAGLKTNRVLNDDSCRTSSGWAARAVAPVVVVACSSGTVAERPYNSGFLVSDVNSLKVQLMQPFD